VLAANNKMLTPAKAAIHHTSVGSAVGNARLACDAGTLRALLAAETWPIWYKVKKK
jgi:hypothetical protein